MRATAPRRCSPRCALASSASISPTGDRASNKWGPMAYFRNMGKSVILSRFVRHGRPNRVQSDRRGSPRMSQLSVFKAWVIAKLGITDERGANLVEYVFLLVFIALVVVIAVTALGGKVSEKFSTASSKLG